MGCCSSGWPSLGVVGSVVQTTLTHEGMREWFTGGSSAGTVCVY